MSQTKYIVAFPDVFQDFETLSEAEKHVKWCHESWPRPLVVYAVREVVRLFPARRRA